MKRLLRFYLKRSPISPAIILGVSVVAAILEGLSLAGLMGLVHQYVLDSPEWPKSLRFLQNLSRWDLISMVSAALILKTLILAGLYVLRARWMAVFWSSLRCASIDRLDQLSFESFTEQRLGKWHQLMTSEIDRLAEGFRSLLSGCQKAVEATVLLGFCLWMDPGVAWATIGGLLTMGLVLKGWDGRVRKDSQAFVNGLMNVSHETYQWLQHQKRCRVGLGYGHWSEQLRWRIRKLEPLGLKQEFGKTAFGVFVEPVLAICLGTYLFWQLGQRPEEIVTLMGASFLLYRCLQRLALIPQDLARLSAVDGSVQNFEDRIEALNAYPSRRSTWEGKLREFHLDDIGFGFGELTLFRGLKMSLRQGEIAGLSGSVGVGKTTLLDIISGIREPTTGCVYWNGKKFDPRKYRYPIGYLTQTPAIFHDSLWNNLTLFSERNPESLLAATKTLELVGLSGWMDWDRELGESGAQISGGQRVLLGLARELYLEPELVLLDEPTASLDLASREKIYHILDRIRSQYTIVVASHDELLLRRCDQIIAIQAKPPSCVKNNTASLDPTLFAPEFRP